MNCETGPLCIFVKFTVGVAKIVNLAFDRYLSRDSLILNMVRLNILIILLLAFGAAHSQNKFNGIWEGRLPLRDSLPVIFNITTDKSGKLVASMDSPDQGAYELKADTVYGKEDSLFIVMKSLNASFSGKTVNDSVITGIFKQGLKVPLTIRKVRQRTVRVKYQTPNPPFDYSVKEVSFQSTDKSISFAGTLTHPKDEKRTYSAILLLSGSGPQNRDEEILGHKPFHVLADFFTKKGFAVLRVDDRGTGSSTGKYENATTADFLQDANAAVNYLKSLSIIDKKKIGLMGHSEGGLIAYMLAAQNKEIDFIVLLAAPGMPMVDMMAEQNIAILKANKISDSTAEEYGRLYRLLANTAVSSPDTATARTACKEIFAEWLTRQSDGTKKEMGFRDSVRQNVFIRRFVKDISTPWFRYFLKIDPSSFLQRLDCKVLALNGEKDVQVVAKPNLDGIRAGLQKSKSSVFEVNSLPGLNHLFQHCTRCTTDEYGKIDETFSPDAMNTIAGWLQKNILNSK